MVTSPGHTAGLSLGGSLGGVERALWGAVLGWALACYLPGWAELTEEGVVPHTAILSSPFSAVTQGDCNIDDWLV